MHSIKLDRMCIKIGNVNNQFILFLLIIALGYIFKRLNFIKEDDADGISRIVFNITLPALIIVTFNNMKLDISLAYLSMSSLTFGIFMSIVSIFAFKKDSRNIRGNLSMLVPGFNIGLFAYPVIEAIWGSEGLKYIGMFDMGNSIVMFVICYLFAAYFSSKGASISYKTILKQLVTSIPLMCYIVTLILNIFGLHYPTVLINVSNIVSKANGPLSLLLLGICLNFNIDKIYRKYIVKVLFLRYFIGLALGSALFMFLPFNSLFRHILLIGFILPIGMAVIPYAVEFNYDKKLVGTLCNITIILSFILIWCIVVL